MNKYELGVVVRTGLEEENFQAEMERVKTLITRFGGVIDKVDEWGRRKLAYPIQKQQDGMYTFITFSSESNAPVEIESRMRLQENVFMNSDLFWHTGGAYGLFSQFMYCRETMFGIVVITTGIARELDQNGMLVACNALAEPVWRFSSAP